MVALLFVDALWSRKVAYFLGGWALSKLFGDSVQGLIGTNLETARALTALFGLTVVEKTFDLVHSIDVKRIALVIVETIERRLKG